MHKKFVYIVYRHTQRNSVYYNHSKGQEPGWKKGNKKMKQLTKKAIANAPKYMVAIDWKAAYRNTIDFQPIEASDILEAMKIAEKFFNENVYLLAIMEKTGEVHENEFLVYEDKLTSRNLGNWHPSDAEHSECPFNAVYHVENNFAVIR